MTKTISKTKRTLALVAIFFSTLAVMADLAITPVIGMIYGYYPDHTSAVNYIVSGPMLVLVAASLITPLLTRRFNKKTVFIAAAVIFSIGAIFGAAADDPLYICFTRTLVGIGEGVINAVGIAYIADLYENPQDRNKITGFYNAAQSLMGMILSYAAGIADLLPAVVISQLVNKGAPIIAACFRNNVDFRTMKLNHSRPEMITTNCATAEVWRYMGLPFCCNMANTGNGDFGPLSAFEKAIQYYSVMLSGINMCYGLGCYEEGMLLRPSDLIFANEVIGYLETLVKGFPVDQDTLAEDLIDEVGPGGTYLMEEHTMEHLYSFWTPDKLAPRKLGEGVSLEQDLAEAALAIIEKGPRHPLSPGKQQAIDALMEKVRARSKK